MLQTIFEQFFVRSWWVLAFMLLCAILYEQGLKAREVHFHQLSGQLQSLQREKQAVLELQESLQLQINSQSDLAWIELTLMKGLGLVPEDQQKVYFYPN